MSNFLLFFGLVLLVIPTWMRFTLLTAKGNSLISRLVEASKITLKMPSQGFQVQEVVVVFQLWGLYWLIWGCSLKFFGEGLLEGLRGTFIMALIILLPLVVFTFIAVENQRK